VSFRFSIAIAFASVSVLILRGKTKTGKAVEERFDLDAEHDLIDVSRDLHVAQLQLSHIVVS
jgi:hypothetical protein